MRARRLVLPLVSIALAVLHSPAAAAQDQNIRQSVVKIYTTHRLPDPFRPWTKADPQESSGTGFVIDRQRILTNAHVVNYPSQIYVQAYQSSEKVPAQVESIALAMDLAVLKLDDENFFAKRPPLVLDDALPRVRAAVNVYGFPIGGDQISVTEGIASRVEYTGYYQDTAGLRIQIDAALNPGNSGGPAVSDGKVIGVAFLGMREAENIGYLIPAIEVKTYLADVADGKYDGKPRLWGDFQTTENDALRAWLKLPAETGGCMVAGLHDAADDKLDERDVVTHVGPHALDRDGNVRLGDDLQVMFQYYVPELARDGTVPLTVLRAGETLKLDVPVTTRRKRVIPSLDGAYPSYFILGPLVFSTATEELVLAASRSRQWGAFLLSRTSPLLLRLRDWPAFDGEQLVVIASPFFSHRITKGYQPATLQVVQSVNGTAVKNLEHLVELLRDAKDEFLDIRFVDRESEAIVFRRQELLDCTEDILTDNGIRKQYSDDLRPIWEK